MCIGSGADNNRAKKRSERRKHCALAVVRQNQNFRPAADPLPGGARRPKFNQVEMVTIFHLQTQFGEDRYTQFRVIVVTDPQTNKPTNKPTNKDARKQRTDYNTLYAAKLSTHV